MNDEAKSASLTARQPATLGRPASYDVRAFGAVGDGRTIDSTAINLAIATARANGGGTVILPAGEYLCYSIRLQSNIELRLDAGCTIVAADATGEPGAPGYDPPEPNAHNRWQDFGHSHFRNSLIWGDGLENVSITGPGRIWGKGLSDGHNKGRADRSDKPASTAPTTAASAPASTRTDRQSDPRDTLVPTPGPWRYRPAAKNEYPNKRDTLLDGVGNKAIALKNCRNLIFRDFSVLEGGHFGFLLTGCENVTLDNLTIDTNRDGIDIDACRNVRVSNCAVNSPGDDGICLKSSYALGYAKPCEEVTITNCYVTGGYRMGTLLNGKRERIPHDVQANRTGRIKLGTESNGTFKNITISNCVMEYCRGLAIESVDGGSLEDISISNLVMRDITKSPIFIRLGNRARGPDNPRPGFARRISISNVVCSNANWRFGSVISGVPGYPIEDLTISNVHLEQQGGGTAEEAAIRPRELEAHYPEPDMFGTMPASGFFLRHIKNLTISDAQITHLTPDARPVFWLEDVHGADFDHVRARGSEVKHPFAFVKVSGLTLHNTLKLPDAADTAPPDSMP